MKDALGSAFILRIMMIFFAVFICFMVIAVSFARTFRVKNGVINELERYSKVDSNVNDVCKAVENYLSKANYGPYFSQTDKDIIANSKSGCNNEEDAICGNLGVCIKIISDNSISGTYHYAVKTYMIVSGPLFNLGMVIPISGESRTIDDKFN